MFVSSSKTVTRIKTQSGRREHRGAHRQGEDANESLGTKIRQGQAKRQAQRSPPTSDDAANTTRGL